MFGNLFERENNKTKTEDVVSIVPKIIEKKEV